MSQHSPLLNIAKNQKPETKNDRLQHIAIIMDGNGRWAKGLNKPRIEGHQQGAEALRNTLRACADQGIKWLTVYAFSSENWNRPEQEVQDLMGLLKYYLGKEIETLHKEGTALRFIGNRDQLSADIKQMLDDAENKTKDNQAFHLNIALSYGSRQELTQTCKHIAIQVKQGLLDPEQIDEALLDRTIYTSGMPKPDLLIRTGGEQRLSNFLLWQLAYTELYFTDTLWPDFSQENLLEAIKAYSKRERRYGNTQ